MTVKALLDDINTLLADELVEKKADRRPFKRASSIGPGPKSGWAHGSKHHKRDYWKCKCTEYTCKCKGKEGEKKTVRQDPEKKSGYNALYKRWHRARLHKAAPGHFIGRNKKDIARKDKFREKVRKAAKKRRKYK